MTDILTALLPFLILLAFWAFLMRRVKSGKLQHPETEKLEEIRQELERIRRALERDPYRH